MIWWAVIAAACIVALVYSQRGPNAVWGTATVGALVGVVLALVYPGHFWWTLAKAVAVGSLIGFAFELLATKRNT